MKAIRVHEFGPPEVMRWEAVDDPVPGPGQFRVRIQAVGVNPVDTYVRAGTYANLPPLPYTPGSDAAGVVDALGQGATGRRVGDRVYTFRSLTGTYAEMAVCEAGQLFPLPDNVSFEAGAALGVPCATAWRALFQKGSAMPGESVLVHGATGGVGSAAVQLARAAGLHVVGTGGTEDGRRRVADLGAHMVLDHHASDYLERAAASTPRGGFDLVVELLANVNLARDLGVLAMRGRVVVVGNRGSLEIDPRRLMARDASIIGMVLFNATPAELQTVHAALYAALEKGTLKPVVDRQMPLAQAAEAHRGVMKPGAQGKIILVP